MKAARSRKRSDAVSCPVDVCCCHKEESAQAVMASRTFRLLVEGGFNAIGKEFLWSRDDCSASFDGPSSRTLYYRALTV